MASQPTAPAGSPPSAQVVGNAFVQQYYHILHRSPELVFRFYQEGSKLGRPDAGGGMSHITTMQAINEKILSMDYGECIAEIKTVDAQESLNGGVIVLVTGFLTGKDTVKRDFTQSFFLATQDKGYFVLNDVFRYIEEAVPPVQGQESEGLANGTATATDGPYPPSEQDTPQEQEELAPEHAETVEDDDEGMNEEEVYNPSDHEEVTLVEEKEPVEEVLNEVPTSSPAAVADSSTSIVPEEAPKKSYASIVKKVSAPLQVPAPVPRPAPVSIERQAAPPVTASTHEVLPQSANSPESSASQEAEADGYSIYIKSLPLNATPVQLEEEFKKFGSIKPNGIQVRSHKQQGFCFGFVEFETASAVQSAIEASPIMIGGRQAFVEEKRPTGSRGGIRGRFPPGRGSSFRTDGMRGRVNYGGGRGYGRGEYNRVDFGGRGGGRGGPFGRNGEQFGYQRVDQMASGGGRGGRTGPLASPRGGGPPRVSSPA